MHEARGRTFTRRCMRVDLLSEREAKRDDSSTFGRWDGGGTGVGLGGARDATKNPIFQPLVRDFGAIFVTSAVDSVAGPLAAPAREHRPIN